MKRLNQNKSALLRATTIITAIVLSLTLCSCGFLGGGTEEFDSFLDELFVSMLNGDFISTNILLENPDAYELSVAASDVSLYTPASSASDYQSAYSSLSDVASYIMKYNYRSLTKEQQKAYNVLLEYFSSRSKYADYYYFQDDYLSSYLGTNANLPIYLDKISFRTTADVDCYIALVESVPTAFSLYVSYERSRCANGYGRADYVYDGIIEQAQNFAPEGTDTSNYLIADFNDKLDDSGLSLTASQIDDYRTRNQIAVTTDLLPAYRQLAADIATLMNDYPTSSRNQLGLSHYNGGSGYYELLFQQSTSTNDTPDEAFALLSEYRGELVSQYFSVLSRLQEAGGDATALINQIYAENDYSSANLQSVISELSADCAADFPSVGGATVNFVLVNESMKDNYSPASYVVSPLDASGSSEFIYVNPPEDPTEGYVVFELLAHEGYPGHLYEHLATKDNGDCLALSVIGFNGWSEGWATYTQMYSAKYYDTFGSNKNLAYQLILLNRAVSGIERVMADILVNYKGYDAAALKSWLLQNSAYASSATDAYAQALLEQCVEVPGNAATYFYSYVRFLELKKDYAAKLGSSYSDAAFHSAVMDCGSMTFELLEYYML